MYGCAAPGQMCRMLSMVHGEGSLFHLRNVSRAEVRPERYKKCFLCKDTIEGWDMRRIIIVHCVGCFSRCTGEDMGRHTGGPVLIHPYCLALKRDAIFNNAQVFQLPATWLNIEEMQNKPMCSLLSNLYLMREVKSLGEDTHTYMPDYTGKPNPVDKEPEKVNTFVFPGTIADITPEIGQCMYLNADIQTLPDNIHYCDSLAGRLDTDHGNVLDRFVRGRGLMWDCHTFRQATYGVRKPGIYTKSARSLA